MAGFSEDLTEYLTHILPMFAMGLGSLLLQMGLVYLVFIYYRGKVEEVFEWEMAYLFAGMIVGLCVLERSFWLPISLGETVMDALRNHHSIGWRMVHTGSLFLATLIQCVMAFLLINRSGFRVKRT